MFDRLVQVRIYAFSAGDTITDAEAIRMIRDLWLWTPRLESPQKVAREIIGKTLKNRSADRWSRNK